MWEEKGLKNVESYLESYLWKHNPKFKISFQLRVNVLSCLICHQGVDRVYIYIHYVVDNDVTLMLNNKVLRDAEKKMVKVLSGKKWNWRGMGWGGCEGVGVGKREGGKVMLVPGSLWPPGGVAGCRTESAATSVRRFSSVSCLRSSSVGCRPQHLSPGVCAGYSY